MSYLRLLFELTNLGLWALSEGKLPVNCILG
jgi:hypothetical protein